MRLYKRILLVTVAWYLLGAFVAGSFNSATWHGGGKMFLALGWLVTVFILLLNEEDSNKNNK